MSIYPTWLGTYGTGTGTGGTYIPSALLQTENRMYTTRRVAVADALTKKLKTINGVYPFTIDLENRVFSTAKFIDEIQSYPEVHITTGFETRDYKGSGFKDRYLPINIKCYVHDEDSSTELGLLLEDIETILEDNAKLAYYDRDNNIHYTYNITVLSITTVEVSSPLLLGEILCEVRY